MPDAKHTLPPAAAHEARMFGGVLFGLSVCAAVNPQATLATLVGPDGTTVSSGVPMAKLIAAVIQTVFGMMGMVVGYLALVHDYGNRILTLATIALTQFAWMPFITDMVEVGKGAREDPLENPFIPLLYFPTETDVRFVGAMGIMAIMAYGTAFLGSVAFMEFALYALQTGKLNHDAAYYRGRQTFYAFLPILAGFTQLALGSYILANFGSGPLPHGAIRVAMYVVNFPEISVTVGLLEILFGAYALASRMGIAGGGHPLYWAGLITWVCCWSMQVTTQIAYSMGGAFAGVAPSVYCLTLGIHVMPVFLDWKMRTAVEGEGGGTAEAEV